MLVSRTVNQRVAQAPQPVTEGELAVVDVEIEVRGRVMPWLPAQALIPPFHSA